MADTARKVPVRFKVDRDNTDPRAGKILRLGFEEVAEFEDRNQISVAAGIDVRPFATIRDCLYLGLRLGDQKMTPKAAGQLAQQYLENGGTVKEMTELIKAALEYSGVIRVEEEITEDDEGNASAGDTSNEL